MNESECWKLVCEAQLSGDTLRARQLCESPPCSEVADCQRYLGAAYLYEDKDLDKAFSWYAKAAKQGDKKALSASLFVIRQMYAAGDIERSRELCESHPCADFVEYQLLIGRFYYNRDDPERALAWSLRAAAQGSAEGFHVAGSAHLQRKEYVQAFDCKLRASIGGYARADHQLGDMYARGIGVPVDLKRAAQHYRRSTAHGYLYGAKGLLAMRKRQLGLLGKLMFQLTLPAFVLRVALIAMNNPDDQRLTDLPDALNGRLVKRTRKDLFII